MYEFNGWAVVRSDEGSDSGDDERMDQLLEHRLAGDRRPA